jgi:hypothetical protein
MKSTRLLSLCLLLGFTAFSAGAAAVIDAKAPIVQLQDPKNGNCVAAGSPLNNCFTDISSLNSWIWGTRKPTSATPLVVEIGPGTFGQMFCGDATLSSAPERITFRGAGIDKTILASMTITAPCGNAAFSNMTIGGTGINYAVAVVNPGTHTTWTNVKLAGSWQEYCTGGTTGGRHDWYGSQIVASVGGLGGYYQVQCDQSWFYGSEITSKGDLALGDVIPFKVGGAELHVYGSVIRALGTGTAIPLRALTAVSATGGQVHIHGTGVDVISANNVPANIIALSASTGAMIHANASSYNLSTGTGGTVTRIQNLGGHVHAPYLWNEHPQPPNIVSVTGADTAVVTDGAQPHLVIYSSACASKWFDTSTNACR